MKNATKKLVSEFCFAKSRSSLREAENTIVENVDDFKELKQIAERLRFSSRTHHRLICKLLKAAKDKQLKKLYAICLQSNMVNNYENEVLKRNLSRGMKVFN